VEVTRPKAIYEVSYLRDKADDSVALIGVRLTDSMLMIPTMSESGIVFPTETEFASCQVSHREACPRRRAPSTGPCGARRAGTERGQQPRDGDPATATVVRAPHAAQT